MFAGAGIYAGGGTFQQNYRCYPVSFIDKAHLEEGNKVILPPSALDRLAMLHIDYPMLFKMENKKSKKTTHCGVLEFVADEGMIYIPYWMMQNLLIEEGDIVSIRSATLPKGKFVKLQPHTKDFLDISNPKAVLERTLRNYSCLSVGDAILVPYNNKNYYIDIIEAKPEAAVSIVETDCEVDFAPPLDYVEPERQPSKAPTGLGGAPPSLGGSASGKAPAEPEPEPEPEGPMAFAGSGRRLDGKPAGPSAPRADVPRQLGGLDEPHGLQQLHQERHPRGVGERRQGNGREGRVWERPGEAAAAEARGEEEGGGVAHGGRGCCCAQGGGEEGGALVQCVLAARATSSSEGM